MLCIRWDGSRERLNEIFHLAAAPFCTMPDSREGRREGRVVPLRAEAGEGSTRGKLSCHRIPHSCRRARDGERERGGEAAHGDEAGQIWLPNTCGPRFQVQDDLVRAAS